MIADAAVDDLAAEVFAVAESHPPRSPERRAASATFLFRRVF
jgi:hypothetical protein